MSALPLAFALCFTGFAVLAAAMPRHWRQIGLERKHPQLALRLVGGVALICMLVVCCTIWNPARAIPISLGLASFAAISVALVLSFAPRVLPAATLLLSLSTGAVALWG